MFPPYCVLPLCLYSSFLSFCDLLPLCSLIFALRFLCGAFGLFRWPQQSCSTSSCRSLTQILSCSCTVPVFGIRRFLLVLYTISLVLILPLDNNRSCFKALSLGIFGRGFPSGYLVTPFSLMFGCSVLSTVPPVLSFLFEDFNRLIDNLFRCFASFTV